MFPWVLASSAMTNPVTVGAASGGVTALGAIAALLLIALLILRELLAAYVQDALLRNPHDVEAVEHLARATQSATVPLACVFGLVVVVKILEVL